MPLSCIGAATAHGVPTTLSRHIHIRFAVSGFGLCFPFLAAVYCWIEQPLDVAAQIHHEPANDRRLYGRA